MSYFPDEPQRLASADDGKERGLNSAEEWQIAPLAAGEAGAVRTLVLAGLAERFGALDGRYNQDLNDIAGHYAGAVFLVVRAGGTVIGCGALQPEPERPGEARIVRMSVARAWRRRGVGRALLAALFGEARRQGLTAVVLETDSDWISAIAFYEAADFINEGTRAGETHFRLALEGQ